METGTVGPQIRIVQSVSLYSRIISRIFGIGKPSEGLVFRIIQIDIVDPIEVGGKIKAVSAAAQEFHILTLFLYDSFP